MFFLSESEDQEVTGEFSVSGIAMNIRQDDKPETWKFTSSGHWYSLSQSMAYSCKLGPGIVLSTVMQFSMEVVVGSFAGGSLALI